MEFVKQYLVVGGIFVAIDVVWLTVIAGKFYKRQLGSLLRSKARLGPAVAFYALYIFGIIVLVLRPALQMTTRSVEPDALGYAVTHAALLGLVMYATYDLTNLATLKHWPVKITIVDMLWGTFVTTAVTLIAFLLFAPSLGGGV